MMRPCLHCGEPSNGPRCPEHQRDLNADKPNATARGYDHAWRELSKRARKLQPFCEDCGALEDLQCDHRPSAWQRKAAGQVIRLSDVAVVCGECNRARGTARGPHTRGDDPNTAAAPPPVQAKFESEIA